MQFTRTRTKALSRLLSLALLLSALLTTALADDFPFQKAWTTVGSAGTVDEADRDKLVFQGANVGFREILPPLPTIEAAERAQAENAQVQLPLETTHGTIRYNVVATDGLFQYGACVGMQLRFRDDGDRARVFARLIEVNLTTGAAVTRLTFDSNAFPASNNFQTQSVGGNFTFDFGEHAYYVEVTLTKVSSPIVIVGGGRPSLTAIQIRRACIIT